MSMSPDVYISKNTEDEINELQDRITELKHELIKANLTYLLIVKLVDDYDKLTSECCDKLKSSKIGI